MVVLQETALFGGAKDIFGLGEALDEAWRAPCRSRLQLPFGDAGEVLGELMELDVEAIGVDFYATDLAALPRPFPKTLLAGVDRRPQLFAGGALKRSPGSDRQLLEELEGDLHFVPNGDLQFVPEKIAREKVLRLGEAARILKEEQ